jgi:AraC family transcriptional regulator of adaptative response/methylated-DNA-[protein]-cysteine methyltransferase
MDTRSIAFTILESSLGRLLVAGTERGVCHVRFGQSDSELEAGLRGELPYARLRRDDVALKAWGEALLCRVDGREPRMDVPLDVAGSAFQRRVWNALRRIPAGRTRSYSDVAQAIGRPTAVRAVANACAENPVALEVPCHRVVPKSGGTGRYRWGNERKRLLLERERRASLPA